MRRGREVREVVASGLRSVGSVAGENTGMLHTRSRGERTRDGPFSVREYSSHALFVTGQPLALLLRVPSKRKRVHNSQLFSFDVPSFSTRSGPGITTRCGHSRAHQPIRCQLRQRSCKCRKGISLPSEKSPPSHAGSPPRPPTPRSIPPPVQRAPPPPPRPPPPVPPPLPPIPLPPALPKRTGSTPPPSPSSLLSSARNAILKHPICPSSFRSTTPSTSEFGNRSFNGRRKLVRPAPGSSTLSVDPRSPHPERGGCHSLGKSSFRTTMGKL